MPDGFLPEYGPFRGGAGTGFEAVERLPDEAEDGKAYYLEADQYPVYVESDFNLDFRPGTVTEDPGTFNLSGFATAAAVLTTPGVLSAAGTLEGSGAGIFYLVNRAGFAQLALTPAARAEFGDAITLGLISYAGADIGDSRSMSVEGINAAYIIYTGDNLLPQNFRWGGDGAHLVIRLQGNRRWLLPNGNFARLGDTNPDGEIEYRKGYYIVEDGRYVQLSVEVVDRLVANPRDGLIAYVPESYLGPPSTIELVGGAINEAVGYTIASVADDIVVGAAAQNVGSLEGSGDDGAIIPAFWFSPGRHSVYVLAQEDLTLAAFHAPGGRYALIELDVGDAHAIRVAGYRWWAFSYDRHSLDGQTIFGVRDATTATWLADAFAAGIGINIEDSDGNYLSADGAWVDPDTLRSDVDPGYYFSENGAWVHRESDAGGTVTAATNLFQNGSDEEGLEVALTIEGAGADWGMVADTRDVLEEAYIDFYTGALETDNRPGFRLSLNGNAYRGERGNGVWFVVNTTSVPAAPNVAITGPRYEPAGQRHAIYILTKAGVALTLNQVIAALNANAGTSAALINRATGNEAYDISRSAAQRYGSQEDQGGGVVFFHDGEHEPLTPVVDETAKTLTVPYDVHIDDLNAIAAAINGTEGAEAILTHGATGTNAPEAAGFTRSFEGRRGAAGADTSEDPIARQLARAAQTTADGKLGSVVFRSAPSAMAFAQNVREANNSGNVYFLYISADYQVDGFPYETGETYIWDQSVPGFVKVAAAIDHDDIVRLISFDIADVASAAELATFLRTDNTRSGNLLRITADFESGGVDYKNLDLWAYDTTDGVLKRLYRQPDLSGTTVPAEMPFLHAVLAPAVPAGAGLNVDEAVPTGWAAVRLNRGTESSDDWDDHFTLPALGDDEIECDFDGRIQLFAEIECDGLGGGGQNYRTNVEIRARRTRGANTTVYNFGRTYIRGQTYSGSVVVAGSTWIAVEDGDHVDIQIRRATNNANATLHTGRFGFLRLRGAAESAGSGLSQSPGNAGGGAQVHPIFDQAGLDAAAALARAGGVHFAYMILDVGLWQAGYTLVWDTTRTGWLAIGRTNFNQVVAYTEIASQAELDALALDGVQLVRITTAFGAWAVDDILTYITTTTTWRKIGSVAPAPASSPAPSAPASSGYANIHVEQWVTAFGAFQDAALQPDGEPLDAPFGMSRTSGLFLGSGTAGPWHLSPNLAQNNVGVPVWETRARAAPLNDGSGLYDISATQVKRRLTEAGAILYALDDTGRGAAEVPPANWTHFSIRRPDGMRGPWIAKVQPPQSERMLFAIANSFRVARRYALPAEIGTFRLSDYRYLEGRIINYTTGYAAATFRGGGAFLPTALADTVPPAGADQWSAQYGLDRVYRCALGGPHRVASFTRGGSALSAGDWSGLGGLIDITFENPAPSVGTDPSGIVERIIFHANGHPLDDGARFELWGIP